jgi:hypothetical protein
VTHFRCSLRRCMSEGRLTGRPFVCLSVCRFFHHIVKIALDDIVASAAFDHEVGVSDLGHYCRP